MKLDRRTMLAGAAAGLGTFPFLVGGCTENLTPAEARHRGATLQSLTAQEARTLDAFGEVLLPGSPDRGLVHFVDHNLTVPAARNLLIIRNLDVPPPFVDFYRAGLAALEAHAQDRTGRSFAELREGEAERLVGELAKAPVAGWNGPPSPLFYFAVRSDAVDVFYGTQEGIESLGVPYMAHIAAERPW